MALKIMVVDDSAVIRSMILKTLRVAGIEVDETFEAGNGREALDLLEQHWIDLLFADINMPVMNGEEMIREIRANSVWEDLPIVIVSTEGSETRINSLLDANARFIHKPFTPEKVRDVVTEMLGIAQ